jgi:hypothetical protein
MTVEKRIQIKKLMSTVWESESVHQEKNDLQLSYDPVLISHTPRRIHAFVVASNRANTIWQKEFTGSSWSSFREVGGAAEFPPSVASWGYDRIDVFYTGGTAAEKDSIYHGTLFGSSSWSQIKFQRLNVKASGAPVAIARHGTKILDLFYVDHHKVLFHKSMSEDGTWTIPEDLSGPSVTTPAVVSRSHSRIDVFVVHFDKAIYHKAWHGKRWQFYFQKLGGEFDTAPTAVSWAEGRIDLFAVDIEGRLLHKWWDEAVGTWSPSMLDFEELGAGRGFAGTPTVLTDGPGSLEVFVVGKSNGHVYRTCWNGSKWREFEDLGGYSAGRVAAVLC